MNGPATAGSGDVDLNVGTGANAPRTFSIAARQVPGPATLALLVMALLGMVCARRASHAQS